MRVFISFVIFFLLQIIVQAQNNVNWIWQNPKNVWNLWENCFFLDSNNGWLVGECGGVAKTTDSGINWKYSIVNSEEYFKYVQFSDINNGWIKNFYGALYSTSNSGENWSLRYSDLTRPIEHFYFKDSKNGWASIWDKSQSVYKLVRSFDGGNSWIDLINTEKNIVAFNFLTNTTVIAFYSNGKIIKSIDGGNTWQTNFNIVSTNPSLTYYYNYDIGWVTSNSAEYIFKTENGGLNWIKQTLPLQVTIKSIYTKDGSNIIAICSEGLVFTSVNGGTNWSLNASTYNPRIDYKIVDDNIIIGAGSGGNIIRSDNCGKTWSDINSNQILNDMNSVYFINKNVGWAVGNAVLLKTTNNGETWIKKTYPKNYAITSVYFLDELTGWIGGYGSICKTTDGGDNWIEQTYSAMQYPNIYSIKYLNKDKGFLCTMGGFYSTENGGKNWDYVELNPSSTIKSICFVDSLTGWIASTNNTYKTTNGGITWSSIGSFKYINSIYFFDDKNGWLAGGQWIGSQYVNRVYSTKDGGTTWSNIEFVHSKGTINSIWFTDLLNGYIVGTSGIMQKTSDGGKKWEQMPYLTNRQLNSLFFVDKQNGWVVGKSGVILKSNFDNSVSVNNLIESELPIRSSLSQNYPNPFNSSTIIAYSILHSSIVTIAVYDILGNKIITLVNKYQATGNYEVEFNASTLTSGVYFYQLQANGFVQTKKLILIK